ncbi:hypothetical protein RclHR1_00650018 [Rhizophagus clarus]|uniref:Uncharacterized protein n=1 Tax=Rhizophagus clarus TaxID=94130 RepID=A0A2Z6SIZ6_9GLOM|nr:hypothetical protein RclHR1_00650018 [Rhizophagus clarus]
MSEKASKLGQVENQDTPIIDSDANAQMDIEISYLEANQSTTNTTLITKESNDETSFQPVLSKSQKKKQCKKAKTEQEAVKALKSSRFSLDPPAKQKLGRRQAKYKKGGLTGYQPALNSQAFVRDIIVYDIPAKWNNFTITNALSDWENVISMTVKRQKKYKILRVKLEISQLFRNYEKHWMAPLMGFPVRWFPAS